MSHDAYTLIVERPSSTRIDITLALIVAAQIAAEASSKGGPMKSPAYQEGFKYRTQAIDAHHGMPVFATGADTQREAITIGNAWREAPEHAGRIIEIVRQSKTHLGDPLRWRFNATAAQWEPVGWNTDDSAAKPTKAPKVGTC